MKTMRVTVAATAAAILLSSLGLTSCNREPVKRSAAEQEEDQQLVTQVTATFATSASFKFPDVQVAAFRKTVQLSGFVVSEDQKQDAEALAKDVPGVQAVENKISVMR